MLGVYGNINIKKININAKGKVKLSSGPYEYFFYNSKEEEIISFNELKSFSIYFLKISENSSVTINNSPKQILEGSVVQVENDTIQINVKEGRCTLIIAGTNSKSPNIKGIVITEKKDIYKIKKPWGHELWINGQHSCYALKQIFIKAGQRTSLQYHNLKKETIVLLEGKALLHYQKNTENISYLEAKIKDITQVELKPVSVLDTNPLTIHRMESVSDIMLYEASTPHLDDVIRISDDTNRVDGYIFEEHNSK